MIKHYKVNRTLALALSLATASVSLSNSLAYAADQSGAIENGNVQTQAQENVSYFRKLPTIGDTTLHINTKKLKDENKLALGDRLQMKLITGSETYKKILVDSVKEGDIKEDYITEQVMGSGGRPLIPYREFSAGDVVELYVVRGTQETKVGNITVKGEKSLAPIVEQTKDNIMMSSKMTGSIKMFLRTKKDNQWKIFDLAKENKPNAISYDFPMEKLKETYGASVGDEFVVVHQESVKGKAISKKMVLKDTYDAPNVEFKERANKDESASYMISLPDNPNLDPTPIQNHLPKLKVVKRNETKTFTLNKASMPQELKAVKGGVLYAIPKDMPNNTTFEFSQVGENFNSSKPVTMTYKVDMKKANEILEELKQYPDEQKKGFKGAIDTFSSKLKKEDITQKEVDDLAQNIESIVLLQLRDKLSSKRQEANKTIGDLKNLDESTKTAYQAKVTGAKSEQQIESLVNEAKAADKKAKEEKLQRDQKQNELKKAKAEYVGKLDNLTSLIGEEKEKFAKDIQGAATLELVKSAYESAVRINLSKAQSAAMNKIEKLKNLQEEEKLAAIEEIKATDDVSKIDPIVKKYHEIHEDRGKAKAEIEVARQKAIEEVQKLSDLKPDEVEKYVKRIQEAGSANEIKDIQKEAVRKNESNLAEKNKAQTLEAAKRELGKLVEEAKAVKLSQDSKLKQKVEDTLRAAEEALKGQSLDAMNGAIQDVKRVMEEVKKEQEQAPTPKDPKQPSPSEPTPAPKDPSTPKPSQPAPSPSNPAQPSPSKPAPSPSKPKPSVEPKEKEKPAPRGKWFNLTFQKATPSKPHTAKTENSRNQTKTYADIQNHWAKEAIHYSLESRLFDDIVKGNRFEPNKAMTRAEFIAILGRFEKVNEFTANISFQDIDMNAYYGKYVNWAKNAGLVYGMDAANFAPNKTISREEMATILYRYKQMKKINFEGEAKQYKDGNKIPKWAKEAVLELSKSKILNGMDDGTFQGKKQLSRAEIAQIVYNINKIR
ncbi:S-layer homology domain-containing protein [Aedoeadaptatus coxii]|uniref:S-layer homology domain-containing protein n=1 Tax=Aedoeadaptatus coxii TaxID=755172 RepID=UPI002AD39C9D|nr:S-layer homology domain-containing protein [Peptoniphilus coxii]